MNHIMALVGGLIGGYALSEVPVTGTFLSTLDPVLNIIGMVSVVVFSGALIYRGVRELIQR